MAYYFEEPSRTFNEYLLIPGYTSSECIMENVSLKTPIVKFRKGEEPALSANIPLVSAAMQAVSDDKMAVVGTVNMDFRSFYFHFECATLMLNNSCIKDIREDFEKTFEECQEKSEGAYYKNFFAKLYGAVLRVISPLV